MVLFDREVTLKLNSWGQILCPLQVSTHCGCFMLKNYTQSREVENSKLWAKIIIIIIFKSIKGGKHDRLQCNCIADASRRDCPLQKKKKKTALIILSNSFKRPMSKQNEPFLSMPSKKTHECFVMRHPMSEQHCLSVWLIWVFPDLLHVGFLIEFMKLKLLRTGLYRPWNYSPGYYTVRDEGQSPQLVLCKITSKVQLKITWFFSCLS